MATVRARIRARTGGAATAAVAKVCRGRAWQRTGTAARTMVNVRGRTVAAPIGAFRRSGASSASARTGYASEPTGKRAKVGMIGGGDEKNWLFLLFFLLNFFLVWWAESGLVGRVRVERQECCSPVHHRRAKRIETSVRGGYLFGCSIHCTVTAVKGWSVWFAHPFKFAFESYKLSTSSIFPNSSTGTLSIFLLQSIANGALGERMVNFGKSLGIGSLAAILQRDGASLTVRFEWVNVDVAALSSNHRHPRHLGMDAPDGWA